MVNGLYSHGQLSHLLPGRHDNAVVCGYTMPGQIVQFGGSNENGMTASAIPMIQLPFPTGNNLFLRNFYFLLKLRLLCSSIKLV